MLSRIVRTQAILFLKSMSERVGSDIQRLWIWMMNFMIDSKSIHDSNSESFSFRQWFLKWIGSGLSLRKIMSNRNESYLFRECKWSIESRFNNIDVGLHTIIVDCSIIKSRKWNSSIFRRTRRKWPGEFSTDHLDFAF